MLERGREQRLNTPYEKRRHGLCDIFLFPGAIGDKFATYRKALYSFK
jgi:hypothetical protein